MILCDINALMSNPPSILLENMYSSTYDPLILMFLDLDAFFKH